MANAYRVTVPTVAVTVAGALRYVEKGVLLPEEVDEAHVKALLDLKFIEKVAVADEVAEEKVNEEVKLPDGDPSDKWTIPQLKLFAENKGVDLGSVTAKADILSAVTAAPAA